MDDRYPAPETIKARRLACELTQERAGELVHATGRQWRTYEAGTRKMHPAFWELFQIKSVVYFNQAQNRVR